MESESCTLKLFIERVLPRYNPENMAGVPSRSYFANLCVRKMDSKHDKQVIEQALIEEKKNTHKQFSRSMSTSNTKEGCL